MEFFQKYLRKMNDFERGPVQFLDNTEIHRIMEDCLQADPETRSKKKDLVLWGAEMKKAA